MSATEITLLERSQIIVQIDEGYCNRKTLEEIIERRFTFNGESFVLDSPVDWLSNPSDDIEWQILLHKFYFAPGLIREWLNTGESRFKRCFVELLSSWVRQVPVDFIASDVTARRLQNWTYAWYLVRQAQCRDAFTRDFRHLLGESVHAQADAVANDLAPSRNHRTLQLYALLVASLGFPDQRFSQELRPFAIRELVDNIRNDLLDDGVHCEQSSDYHHLVLRSYLLFWRLARLNGFTLPEDIPTRLNKALDFSLHLHRPDGLIPALSDADSHSYLELLDWAAESLNRSDCAFVASRGNVGCPPAESCKLFDASGHVIMRSGWEEAAPFDQARYLVLDAGPVGAGNHGHMDALSVEAYAYGRPLIVDPGRFTYYEGGDTDWRARFRGTCAHNTVTVDDLDQAAYGRKRPDARCRILKPHPKTSVLAHDFSGAVSTVHAYVKSPRYHPTHHRSIWFVRGRYWVILDRLINGQPVIHDYRLRFQLTPQASQHTTISAVGQSTSLFCPWMKIWTGTMHESRAGIETGWVSTRYGKKQPAPRLCVRQQAQQAVFLTVIYPISPSEPQAAGGFSPRYLKRGIELTLDNGLFDDSWYWDHNNSVLSLTSSEDEFEWGLESSDA